MRHYAAFGVRFNGIGETVVRRRVRIEQAVQRGVKVIFRAVVEQAFDQFRKLPVPEILL